VTASGNPVPLDPAPGAEESVAGLRRQVALALGKHHRLIRLLRGQKTLEDGPLLSEVATAGETIITAVVVQLTPEELREFVQHGDDEPLGFATMEWIDPDKFGSSYRVRGQKQTARLEFPEPQDININMLPFVMGDVASLPKEYRHYWPLIEACNLPAEELGKVGYLTIQESLVPAGESQRRPGVHIETPGIVMTAGKYHEHPLMWGCGYLRGNQQVDQNPELPKVEGGFYMASNVKSSCNVWQALIRDPGLVVGPHGDLEHLREVLGRGHTMAPNKMYWLTDRTPHESLALEEETYRQFFRLVTSRLSAWFPEHSTANKCGTKPDPAITKILKGNKFNP